MPRLLTDEQIIKQLLEKIKELEEKLSIYESCKYGICKGCNESSHKDNLCGHGYANGICCCCEECYKDCKSSSDED